MKLRLLSFLLIFTFFYLSGNAQDKPQYEIETYRAGTYLGTFNIELFPLIAPLHVANFDSLVSVNAYDSTAFHRVVPGFVIQGGDPNSINGPTSTWGQGNPNQPTVNAEFSVVRHVRGILGAARSADTNSATSQFYITVANATFLDGNYTVYGRVISGMDVVDTIVMSPATNELPNQKIEMFVSLAGYNPVVPDVPVLLTPANGASGTAINQPFTWNAIDSAVMYTVQVATDSLFTNIHATVNAGTNSVNITVQPLTEYYWRVKSNNGGYESAYSSHFMFTSPLPAPVTTAPPHLATGVSTSPLLEWDSVAGATSYSLQLATSVSFSASTLIIDTAGVTSTNLQVNGLAPSKLHYWRVRALNGTTPGPNSPIRLFTTGTNVGINDINASALITSVHYSKSNGLNLTGQLNSKGVMHLTLTDINGRVVAYQKNSLYSGDFRINMPVANLSSGLYNLQILINGEKYIRKFFAE